MNDKKSITWEELEEEVNKVYVELVKKEKKVEVKDEWIYIVLQIDYSSACTIGTYD